MEVNGIYSVNYLIKGGTFERMITRFASLISGHIYEEFIIKLTREYTMLFLRDSNSTFKNHPEALYAVDVTFQQCFRPSGALSEGKLYFSRKHKLYGVKVETAVLPDRLAIGCSTHYPGSVSDFEIMQRQRVWHETRTKN